MFYDKIVQNFIGKKKIHEDCAQHENKTVINTQ